MDDIVAVAVELEHRQLRYFLTWGRIQDEVDPKPLEALVLKHCKKYDLGGKPKRTRLCSSLQEASRGIYFYEHLFSMSQNKMPPFGPLHPKWRKEMNKKMQKGKELYYLGKNNP
jgi:hypothetical protein